VLCIETERDKGQWQSNEQLDHLKIFWSNFMMKLLMWNLGLSKIMDMSMAFQQNIACLKNPEVCAITGAINL
jgi:hypothetical protein